MCTRGLSEWASEALYAYVPARVHRRSIFLGSTSTQPLFVHSSDSIQMLWASSSESPIQLLPTVTHRVQHIYLLMSHLDQLLYGGHHEQF